MAGDAGSCRQLTSRASTATTRHRVVAVDVSRLVRNVDTPYIRSESADSTDAGRRRREGLFT
jgi:hypothetical protein